MPNHIIGQSGKRNNGSHKSSVPLAEVTVFGAPRSMKQVARTCLPRSAAIHPRQWHRYPFHSPPDRRFGDLSGVECGTGEKQERLRFLHLGCSAQVVAQSLIQKGPYGGDRGELPDISPRGADCFSQYVGSQQKLQSQDQPARETSENHEWRNSCFHSIRVLTIEPSA